MLYYLPLPLIALSLFFLPFPLIYSQQSQMTLSINTVVPMTLTTDTVTPITLALPSTGSDSALSISVALCTTTQPFPKFFVSNDSDASGAGGGGTSQLYFDEGTGTWTGGTSAGGRLVVYLGDGASSVQGGQWTFEIGVSSGGPLHRNMPDLPLLGDTTATQALIFSPAFSPSNRPSPTYPNYTLPGGNLSLPNPPPPSAQTNASLILAPTSQLPQQLSFSMTKSACALKAAANGTSAAWISTNGTGGVNGSTTMVLRDEDGWRSQWIVEGLTANTNYTAWVVQDGGAISGPIYVYTKSPSFACPLVHSLPFCPLTSYSVPFPSPPDGAASYTSSNLPPSLMNPLVSSLSNFTTALLTFPCGRDVYSPIQTCESCATAYRTWACAISFPRCGEIPAPLASSLASQPNTVSKPSKSNNLLPTPALLPRPPTSARNPVMQNISATAPYNELLPCIETCQAVDRACPPMLGWSCPHTNVNANWSYGIGFIDGHDGTEGRGVPGVAQDQWGVSWCNG